MTIIDSGGPLAIDSGSLALSRSDTHKSKLEGWLFWETDIL